VAIRKNTEAIMTQWRSNGGAIVDSRRSGHAPRTPPWPVVPIGRGLIPLLLVIALIVLMYQLVTGRRMRSRGARHRATCTMGTRLILALLTAAVLLVRWQGDAWRVPVTTLAALVALARLAVTALSERTFRVRCRCQILYHDIL
jgi:hypothetical protein